MAKPSAKVQALVVLAAAVLLGVGWAIWGEGLRVRWLVARGAPPAPREVTESAVREIQAAANDARPVLLDILRGGAPRSRKAWVATLLLGPPFFEREAVEAALLSPDTATARAAAFALLEGDRDAPSFEVAASRSEGPAAPRAPPRSPPLQRDLSPAIPVLTAWVRDRDDPEAAAAALLLGRIPAGNAAVKEALLQVVDEIREVLAKGAPPALQRRRIVIVNALQALLNEVRTDPSIAQRVANSIQWIEDQGLGEDAADYEFYALRLLELTRGRGLPPGLFERLAGSPSPMVRQRLAGTLEAIPGPESARILEKILGSAEPIVRQAALLAMMKRRDRDLVRLAPWLLEDSYAYIAAHTVLALGQMETTDPEGCRALIPMIVACIEEPWPSGPVGAATLQARFRDGAREDIIANAAITLYKLADAHPGFTVDEIHDQRKRGEIAIRLRDDPAKRRALVEEWRKTVAPWPPEKRVPHLVARLEDADPDNAIRAMRELSRLLGDATGFPPAAMQPTDDDTAPRNAVREWRKTEAFRQALEHWKAKAR